jgi:hypothetical protein
MEAVMVSFWTNSLIVVFGYKDNYDGTSFLKASQNSVIYVRANYRVLLI